MVQIMSTIEDMVWSYSRIASFDDCKYKWYLKYILNLPEKKMFFSSYGSFVHQLIDEHYTCGKTSEQLYYDYLQRFKSNVVGDSPSQQVFESYFLSGLQYFKTFRPLPYNTIETEKKVLFQMKGLPFIGYIDFIGEKENELLIADHKSRMLKPRSARNTPTKSDEILDNYLRQLYLYSCAVEQSLGHLPKLLCFNCFRTPILIEEPFCKTKYLESQEWFLNKICEIIEERDFNPSISYFKCRYLCEMQDHCEYYNLSKR